MSQAKPHVAFYLRMLSGGGAERVIVNLAQGFVQKGVKVDLVLNIVKGPYLEQLSSEVRIIDLKTPRLLKGLPRLARYLKKERPQALFSALHYNNEIAILAKYLARVSTRVVVSERNTLSVRAKNITGSERWSPLFARLSYSWADGIVAVSQGVAQDLANLTGIPQSQIQVIYNPVKTLEVQNKAKEPLEHAWFANGEPPVILGVGRLHKQKDFPTLIQAFKQVREVQTCRLIILGVGPEKQKLITLVEELGLKNDVAILGFAKNPYAYMAQSTVFVLSSAWEGFSNVILEAMAVGTPVISTNCQSGSAEALDNGKYGLLVSVGDSQAMAEAILQVLSGQTKSVDLAWLDQFSLENITQQYLDILGIKVKMAVLENGLINE